MKNDDFFIGWLPTPTSLVRFLAPLISIVTVGLILAAFVLATYQKDPGMGAWEVNQVVTMRGLVGADPYATLWVVEPDNNNATRTFLLVEDGKFGALPRISQVVSSKTSRVPVEVRGTILHRDDRWMLALEPGDPGMRLLDNHESNRVLSEQLDQRPSEKAAVTLRGEFIDPKCYLGAMKPGGGKTHKACAMRCIAGGIPPMLVTRDAAKRETYYLLVDENGGVANELVYRFVGDQVEISGHVETGSGMHKLYLSPKNILRR